MEAIVAVNSDWGIGKDGTQQVVLKAVPISANSPRARR